MAEGWHHQDIVAAVKKRGSNLARLAAANGYAKGSLHRSLYKRYPKAHAVIAEFIGIPRHVIWPQWYDKADRLRPLAPYQKRAFARTERSAA